jgi:hypothetical protein
VTAALLNFSFAAQTAPVEQLKHVPRQFWINLAICIVALVLILRVWRALKRFNDYAPYFAAALAAAFIFFYWVYERTEPAFLTPIVDRIAPFVPTHSQQDRIVEKARKN